LGVSLGYLAIRLGFGGFGLLIGIGASFLIANGWSFPRSADKRLPSLSVNHLAQFARYGLPFSIGALAFSLHSVLDRLGVAYLLGESGVGYYGLSADITRQLIGILAASVASSMFPMAFRTLAEIGPVAARERLKEGLELLLAMIAPVGVGLAISADVFAGALLGSEFQLSAATLLPVLAFGRLCGAVNQFYLQVSFQLAEKPLLQVVHDILILGLNIVLFFVLTPIFGLVGTAAAVLIAEAIGILIGIALSRRAFRLPFNGRGVLRVCAATAVMALVAYAARSATAGHGMLTLLCVVGGGAIAYAGAAVMFDVVGVRSSMAAYLRPHSVPAE
jgi:O-antigen/teichoic acid export membrane protein